ncbi:MAG: class C beta-lactamase-related serine hydrolase [Gemmatimonadales bacterium]|nr:MAG: class C beta-lactamase-related serine hydrolase [Gemmatimonadales bacterium]
MIGEARVAEPLRRPPQPTPARRPSGIPRGIRWGILAVALVSLLLYGGYRYLLTTDWGPAFTLFADGHRTEHFQAMDRVFPSVPVQAGADVRELVFDARPLPARYIFAGEERETEAFLVRTETTGLVVLRADTLVHEAYGSGWSEASPATSWSVAKSVVSALVGIALAEGGIESLDDPVTRYVPELAGSGYDEVPIRHLLTMSSGVDFDEGYTSSFSDINWIFVRSMALGEPMLSYYAGLERIREPGVYNEYASSDTGVLAHVLARATGMSPARYLESRIWRPAGMESDAFWNTDRSGDEIGFCCLNAVLRDWARFGLLYLEDGMREGRRILPEGWVARSVEPEAPHLEPGPNPDSHWTFGYGYKWWIPEGREDGEFTAIGVYGQYIYVNPARGVVVVKTGTDPRFDDHDHEAVALFRAIAREVGREP